MSRLSICCSFAALFLSAGLAFGQAGPAGKLVVKVDPGGLPENARLRLGRLSGYRYNGAVSTAVMSPDGARLAVTAKNRDAITVLDPVSGKIIQQLQQRNFGGGQGAMVFSGDGSTLAMQSFQALHVWDVATGKELQHFKLRNLDLGVAQALSGDGKILGVGTDTIGVPRQQKGEVKAYDVTSGKEIGVFETIHNANIHVVLWDILGKHGPKLAPLTEKEIADDWNALAAKGPGVDLMIRRLVQTPATTAFLSKHLEPAKNVAVKGEILEKLVEDLDSSIFQKREAATKELKRLGERASAVLKQALEQKPSIETARRIQDVLDQIVRQELTPAELQAIRAVEILERIGTAEARAVLSAVAKCDSAARTTQEAAAALKRMR